MDNKTILTMLVGAALVAAGIVLGLSINQSSQPVVDQSLGSAFPAGVTRFTALNTGSIVLGTSGSTNTFLTKGATCNLIGSITIAASSTVAMDCAVAGVVSGDTVFFTVPNTAPTLSPGAPTLSFPILSASASSTAGFVSLKMANATGVAAMPPGTATSSIQILVIR